MGDDIFPAENYSNSTRKSLLIGIKLKLFKYLSIAAILLLLASTSFQATTLVINASTSSDCEADPLCWPSDSISALDADDVVPLPTAFWLFGTALIGFVGVSRRRAV